MNSNFANLSHLKQLHLIRQAAKELISQFGFPDANLTLINHGWNTTYKVETKSGKKFALRININCTFGEKEIHSEVEWVHAIAKETDIHVPMPQKTTTGEFIAKYNSQEIGKNLVAVLYSWLEGRQFPTKPSVQLFQKHALMTKALHDHGEKFAKTAQVPIRKYKSIYEESEYKLDSTDVKFDPGVISEFEKETERVLNILRKQHPRLAIHADLHAWNIKVQNGKLCPFDFETICLGWKVHDISIAHYYFRGKPGWEKREIGFWQSYGSSPDEMGLSNEDYEILVGSRALLLLNEVIGMKAGPWVQMKYEYGQKVSDRLKHCLKKGIFNPQAVS